MPRNTRFMFQWWKEQTNKQINSNNGCRVSKKRSYHYKDTVNKYMYIILAYVV